jgi:hypothetical protein
MVLMPKHQLVVKDAIQFKIDSARQCQLGRRSRPPQSLPSSWHSHFYGAYFPLTRLLRLTRLWRVSGLYPVSARSR